MRTLFVRILFGLLFFLTAFVAFQDNGLFLLKEIRINSQSDPTQKMAWMGINSDIEKSLHIYRNRSLWSLSLNEVKASLQKYPYLEEVQISKEWPHGLIVSFKLPRLELIKVLDRQRYQALAESGQWVGPLVWTQLPSLPWFRPSSNSKSKPLQIHSVLELLHSLPKEGPLRSSQISEIHYSESKGFSLSLMESDHEIFFGFEDFEVKALRTNQVLEFLQKRNLESRVIDATFSKKVLVRPRNQP